MKSNPLFNSAWTCRNALFAAAAIFAGNSACAGDFFDDAILREIPVVRLAGPGSVNVNLTPLPASDSALGNPETLGGKVFSAMRPPIENLATEFTPGEVGKVAVPVLVTILAVLGVVGFIGYRDRRGVRSVDRAEDESAFDLTDCLPKGNLTGFHGSLKPEASPK